MIIGIGIDLVEVRRIKQLINRKNIARIFTAREIKYCQGKKNPAESFAARFAAKEAFFKAIGTGGGTVQSPQWNEIEVVAGQRAKSKSPRYTLYALRSTLRLSGAAQTLCRKLKVTRTHLSLTHTKDYAMAVVVLEGR
ncbi:MAG: holo-ACP synthase [Planctomycetota bacterium]